MENTDLTPVPKMQAVAIAGALTALIAWIASVTLGLELPVPVVAALTTLITFGAGYIKSNDK